MHLPTNPRRVVVLVSNRRPHEGECWSFEETEYWITYVDDNVIHLTDVKSGIQMPPYPAMGFTTPWRFVCRAEESFCPSCEVNLKADGDYLCNQCRGYND